MAKKYFTINEAAKYLKVTPHVIEEMLKEELFHKVIDKNNVVKINKIDIDEWLENLNESDEKQLALERTKCRFSDYFSKEFIIMDLDADNKFQAIGKMSQFAKEKKIVKDHRWLYEVIVAREELVSTAVGKGFAFLHPRHLHPTKIKKPAIFFGYCKDGVEFDAPDKLLVNFFFLLLLHNDKQHLFSLSYLSKFVMNDQNIEKLKQIKDAEEVVKLLLNNVNK